MNLDTERARLVLASPRDRSWEPERNAVATDKALIFEWARSAAFRAAELDKITGVGSHELGTLLSRLWPHKPEELYDGVSTWDEFCTRVVGITAGHARELRRFARVATAEQAEFGMRRAMAGHVLVVLWGLDSFDELLVEDHPVIRGRMGGRPFDFRKSTAGVLEELVQEFRLLAAAEASEPDDVPSRERKAMQACMDRLTERKPELLELEPRAVLYGGVVVPKHKAPRTREQYAALSLMYRDLAKL